MKKNIYMLLYAFFVIAFIHSCSNNGIQTNNNNIIYDTVQVYDTIAVEYQDIHNCVKISPIKTFGLFVNIEIPVEIFVEGISDSLLKVTTDNGTIVKERNYYKIKTEKIGSTRISISKNGKIIANKYFFALQLPKPRPQLGTFKGKLISKKELLAIRGLCATMPIYCDLYSANILSFNVLVYQNGESIKLKSESSRFTQQQIDLFKKLQSGQSIYFENIIAKTQDGNKHELEILKLILK